MSIRLKLSILIFTLFLVAIFNTIFTFQLETYSKKKLGWVSHTHEVLHRTQELLSAITDSETGQRGYLLTSDTSYLEPYHRGIVAAKDYLTKLNILTSDNPSQQAILVSVKQDMLLKFDELMLTIELVQSGNADKALSIVKQNSGKKYMDNIRTNLSTFINAELVLLEQRKGDFRESRTQLMTLIAVEIIFFLGLAIITFTFLQRNFFHPLKLLLKSAKKVESSEKLEVIDVVEKDEMGHLLATFFVMSENVLKREQALDYKAHHDELTGLKNRITLSKEVEASINALESTNDKIAVLFLDLNLFKQVNDTFGHDIGDLILQETANRLNNAVRSSDTVFRIGGDEFLIILRDIKDNRDVDCVAEKILSAFAKPAIIEGKPMDITISIGAALSPDDSKSSNEVIKFADIAMYVAKRDQETSYKVFNPSMLKRAYDGR
ncbi:Putative uncharacterized protein [Moritella viscosa]|uniref:diguanylate cyclase domain-containing protein n=1 Tax=Moritella viscosa TaxID=80854 RepID=UPI00091044D3|nr:diguanylate cyclase [Moritella viscosa]SGY92522.1 Putative uncharacterized protein [Moritella viscosa]